MCAGHLQMREVSQRFGGHQALDRLSLEIPAGEFMTLLGPSGSGKTTTLKIIAGFILPDQGAVVLDGIDLTRVPPHQRDIGMVFQNYALFPHMTVKENVAFPLEMRKVERATIRKQVEHALDLVRLPGLGFRHPRELSGGQQQRVALARALVFRPRLLLMDEPLGALDRKLRETMQFEIIRISRELGITVVYVTHDQEEALAMSHRIAIYHDGRIEQVGVPEEVYQRPASWFVATFIGESTSFLGVIERSGHEVRLVGDGFALPVSRRQCEERHLRPGARAALVVRPEAMRVAPSGPHGPAVNGTALATLAGRLQSSVYLGTSHKHVIELPGGVTALARTRMEDGGGTIGEGSNVAVSWDVEAAIALPEGDPPSLRSPSEPPPQDDRRVRAAGLPS